MGYVSCAVYCTRGVATLRTARPRGMEFDDLLDDAALVAAMDEVCPPPPLPPQPRPPDLTHRHHPPAWPPPPPPAAPCSVPLQPLQPQEEPRDPGAAQDQPPSMSSGPLAGVAVAPTQAFAQQPPTLPCPVPVSRLPRLWASRADGAAARPAPPSGARQASPSVSPRGLCRPVPATPPKRPPARPPRPVSAKERASASDAGGGAAPAAPPSPPRDRAPAPRETVLKVLHLFSGPANKKEGLKATIMDIWPYP